MENSKGQSTPADGDGEGNKFIYVFFILFQLEYGINFNVLRPISEHRGAFSGRRWHAPAASTTLSNSG